MSRFRSRNTAALRSAKNSAVANAHTALTSRMTHILLVPRKSVLNTTLADTSCTQIVPGTYCLWNDVCGAGCSGLSPTLDLCCTDPEDPAFGLNTIDAPCTSFLSTIASYQTALAPLIGSAATSTAPCITMTSDWSRCTAAVEVNGSVPPKSQTSCFCELASKSGNQIAECYTWMASWMTDAPVTALSTNYEAVCGATLTPITSLGHAVSEMNPPLVRRSSSDALHIYAGTN